MDWGQDDGLEWSLQCTINNLHTHVTFAFYFHPYCLGVNLIVPTPQLDPLRWTSLHIFDLVNVLLHEKLKIFFSLLLPLHWYPEVKNKYSKKIYLVRQNYFQFFLRSFLQEVLEGFYTRLNLTVINYQNRALSPG